MAKTNRQYVFEGLEFLPEAMVNLLRSFSRPHCPAIGKMK